MVNQCVMCGAEMPEGGHVCKKCAAGAIHPILIGEVVKPPSPNIELSFGTNEGQCDFSINYYRAKPLNRFQIWMFKVCFGIRARNL